MNSDQQFGIVLLLTLGFIFGFLKLLKGPVGHALARRLGGSAEQPDQQEEMSEMRARIAELEERMEFAERLLLQHPERTEIRPGGSLE